MSPSSPWRLSFLGKPFQNRRLNPGPRTKRKVCPEGLGAVTAPHTPLLRYIMITRLKPPAGHRTLVHADVHHRNNQPRPQNFAGVFQSAHFWIKKRPRPPSTARCPQLAALVAPLQGAHNRAQYTFTGLQPQTSPHRRDQTKWAPLSVGRVPVAG